MANRIQHLRGSNTEHSTYTGAKGEISLVTDTSANRIPTGELRVHDGTTAGGLPVKFGDTTLNDYEEGTFEATISSYTGSAPVINFQNTSGKSSNYTKIGNIICISVSIQIDFNSATTIDFDGLPFIVSSGGGGAQIENNADSVLVSGIVAAIQGSTTFRYILTGTNSGSARNVSFGFSYRTS